MDREFAKEIALKAYRDYMNSYGLQALYDSTYPSFLRTFEDDCTWLLAYECDMWTSTGQPICMRWN